MFDYLLKMRLFWIAATVLTCFLLPTLSWAQSNGGLEYPSLATAPTVERTGSDDVAVIVAIEDYAFLPPVRGAVENGNDWEIFFRQGLGLTNVHFLSNRSATNDQMRRFAQMAADEVGPGGTLWFIFIGHGAPVADGSDGIFVGMDAQQDTDSLRTRGLSQQDLLDILNQGNQGQTVLVADACFSGRDSSGEALVEAQPVVAIGLQPAFSDVSTVILSAAQAREFAGPLPGAERPAFSYLLLGALRGWADGGSGVVTANDALQFTQRTLRGIPGRFDQTPAIFGDGDVVLSQGVNEADPGVRDVMRAMLRIPEEPVTTRPGTPDPDPAVLHIFDVTPSPLTVTVDGRDAGLAPGQIIVPAGRTVTVRLTSPGFVPIEREVEVAAGQLERLSGLHLRAQPAVLAITSNVHGAQILVDGEVLGQTVLGREVELEVPVQGRELTIRLEAYRTETRELDLSPGARQEVNVEMEMGAQWERPEGFVEIPAGRFVQGSPPGEAWRNDNEGPQREVTISRAFALKATPVTQGEWQELMGNNPSPSRSCGSNCPVSMVNWYDAAAYVNALSQREGLEACYEMADCRGRPGDGAGYWCAQVSFQGLSCMGYRLPTEAEWEYAARAGTTRPRYGNFDRIAWGGENSGWRLRPVGQKEPNAFGLYDMFGNLRQWTNDRIEEPREGYEMGSHVDPMGDEWGRFRVTRGCTYTGAESVCRAAFRSARQPQDNSAESDPVGFRPARTIPDGAEITRPATPAPARAATGESSSGCASTSSSGFVVVLLLGLGGAFRRRWI